MKIQLKRHVLILVMGVPGCGKSTFAKEIMKKISCAYLDNNFLADAFLRNTRKSSKYKKIRDGLYRILYRVTEENLAIGSSVLLDVPHVKHVQKKGWRKFISKLVKNNNAKLIVIRCYCSEKVLYERIRIRGERRDSWKLKNWKRFLLEEPIKVHIPFKHLEINTEKSLTSSVNKACKYILKRINDSKTKR